MKTIQEAVGKTIRKTPFVEEALNEKLINVSSLARIILPEVSKLLKKEVKIGAVMMAINRLSPANELRIRKNIKKLALNLGNVIVRSDLCDFTYKNSSSIFRGIATILEKTDNRENLFITISQGIFETTIVASLNLQEEIKKVFSEETLINNLSDLSSITIKLPKENMEQSGVYYFILKQLAWANIAVQEIISTTHEMTIVVKEVDVNKSFSVLMDLKLK